MNAAAGLRWHTALSTEAVRSYKPDPAVYRMAIECADRPPERMLMVAAHAWDLRGARAAGMRTAYLHRPGRGRADGRRPVRRRAGRPRRPRRAPQSLNPSSAAIQLSAPSFPIGSRVGSSCS